MTGWTRIARCVLCITLTVAAVAGTGCASYRTPGGPADFRALGITPEEQQAMTDSDIAERLAVRPAASFPANVAIARVQGRGYQSYAGYGYGSGAYTLAMVRDVEQDEDFETLAAMDGVRGLAPLNRLVITDRIEEMKDIRVAAAAVQADVVMLYTFDTRFGSETTVPAMGVITLGLFPNKEARVTSTCSAAIVDTRSGYVYGLAEGTGKADQFANAWTTRDAVEQSRRRAERRAFESVMDQIPALWERVIGEYASADQIPSPLSSD